MKRTSVNSELVERIETFFINQSVSWQELALLKHTFWSKARYLLNPILVHLEIANKSHFRLGKAYYRNVC